jgi:hypothetical protein
MVLKARESVSCLRGKTAGFAQLSADRVKLRRSILPAERF